MRLDELFARKANYAVWTKTGRNLVCDSGSGAEKLRPRVVTNKLKVMKNAQDA